MNSVEYWGTTLNALESRIEVEAEGDLVLLAPDPRLLPICFADGARHIEIDDLPLQPCWNQERERYEYEIAYRVSPAPDELRGGATGNGMRHRASISLIHGRRARRSNVCAISSSMRQSGWSWHWPAEKANSSS